MSENFTAKVGIELAADKSGSKQIANQLLRDFQIVEQKMSNMTFLDETKIKTQLTKITKMVNGNLKGIDFSHYTNNMLKALTKGGEEGAKAFKAQLQEAYNIMSQISESKDIGKDLRDSMRELNPSQMEKVISLYKKQQEAQAQAADKYAQSIKRAHEIEAKSLASLSRTKDITSNEKYQKSISDANIGTTAKFLGIDDNSKSVQQDLKEYNKYISMYEILIQKRNELAKSSKTKDLENLVSINKTLFDLQDRISKKETALKSNYGATQSLSSILELPDFDTHVLKQNIQQSVAKYATSASASLQSAFENAKTAFANSVTAMSTANLAKRTEEQSRRTERINTKIQGSQTGQIQSSGENIAESYEVIEHAAENAEAAVENLSQEINSGDSSQAATENDLYAQSLENIKDQFQDVIKYAVDYETALERVKELSKKLDSTTLTDAENEDYVGYAQRIMALDKDLPSKVLDDYDDITEDIDKKEKYKQLTSNIDKMTVAQLAEIDRLKINLEQSQNKVVSSATNMEDAAGLSDVEKVTEDIKLLQNEVDELKTKMSTFEASGFDQINSNVEALEQSLQRVNTQISDLQYFLGNKNLAFHAGNLDDLSSTQKPESWTDRIDALKYGYGAWGSGTYLTTNLNDLPDRKKTYAIDLSKYNLYINKTNEDAERLNSFLKQLEKFVLSGGEYRGFDEELQGVNKTSLFNEAQQVFKDINLDIKKFNSFIDQMQRLVSQSGIDADGIYHLKDVSLQGTDSIPTRFMKSLGFEGVNNTRLSEYDNVEHGSVIYDLDRNEPYIKSFNGVQELVQYNQRILSAFSNMTGIPDEVQSDIQHLTQLLTQVSAKAETAKNELNDLSNSTETSQTSDFQEQFATTELQKVDSTLQKVEQQAERTESAVNDVINRVEQLEHNAVTAPTSIDTDTEFKKNEDSLDNEAQTVDDVINEEASRLDVLKQAVNDVTEAVETKTQAFKTEQEVVESSVLSEIGALETLEDKLTSIKEVKQEISKEPIKIEVEEVPVDTKQTENNSTEKTANKKSGQSQKQIERQQKINSAIANAESAITTRLNSPALANLEGVSSRVKTKFEELNQELKNGDITLASYNAAVNKMIASLDKADDSANTVEQAIEKMKQAAIEMGASIHDIKVDKELGKVTASFTDANKELITVEQRFDSVTGTISKRIKSRGKEIGNFSKMLSGWKGKIGDMVRYFASFGSVYEVLNVFKQGFTIIRDLDTELTEMAKVSDENLNTLKAYQEESFGIAQAIGSTGQQIQASTADWMRLGEAIEQAKESAQASNVLYNVSEFESIDAATESLVAMSQAYSDVDKMDIVDKMNNIGNNYAIATDGVATALQKSASALLTAGNDIDESIALITAGNAVIQNPDSVGAGLRTIALRITGTEAAKAELEELGEDTSDFMVQTSAKSQQAILDFTKVASNNFEGFDILDDNGNFKSTYEILLGISEIYDEIVATDKQLGTNMANGLLETLAGKNRANIAASILQNPDLLKSVYSDSQNSAGSALQENEKYLESINGHIDKLKNKWQEVWSGSATRENVNAIIDMGTALLGIVDTLGVIPTTGILGALFGTFYFHEKTFPVIGKALD